MTRPNGNGIALATPAPGRPSVSGGVLVSHPLSSPSPTADSQAPQVPEVSSSFFAPRPPSSSKGEGGREGGVCRGGAQGCKALLGIAEIRQESSAEALPEISRAVTKELGDAGRELFELVKMGELQGVQNVVLTLSLQGKANDVVSMRDEDGMTLLHWAAREGHLDLVKYLVFEANADVLVTCNRHMKAAQHAREQWWMKEARLLEAFEHNRDEQARCIQGILRQIKARCVFGVQHMAAINMQAIVRGKLDMLQQGHIWHFSNMWFHPENYSAREAARVAGDSNGNEFRRVASVPSAWGGAQLEGRHMLAALLQVWYDSFICVTRLIHLRDMTYFLGTGSRKPVCVTRLIHLHELTHSYA